MRRTGRATATGISRSSGFHRRRLRTTSRFPRRQKRSSERAAAAGRAGRRRWRSRRPRPHPRRFPRWKPSARTTNRRPPRCGGRLDGSSRRGVPQGIVREICTGAAPVVRWRTSQAFAKGRCARPAKGFTATKWPSGQSGATRSSAVSMAASRADSVTAGASSVAFMMSGKWRFSGNRMAWPELAEQAVGDGAEVESVQRVHVDPAAERMMAGPPEQRLEEEQRRRTPRPRRRLEARASPARRLRLEEIPSRRAARS